MPPTFALHYGVAEAPKATLLVIEDDQHIREGLELSLSFEGFEVLSAATASDGLRLLQTRPVDLLILDILLPGTDGYRVLSEIRQGHAPYRAVPVLMLTALGAVEHRVRGLTYGADDYLVKPFALAELVARTEAILRRHKPPQDVLVWGELSLDTARMEARREGRTLELTPKEFELLKAFVTHAERLLPKETLMQLVWDEVVDPNTLEVHVSSLRRALGDPPLIRTVRGYGYLLDRAL